MTAGAVNTRPIALRDTPEGNGLAAGRERLFLSFGFAFVVAASLAMIVLASARAGEWRLNPADFRFAAIALVWAACALAGHVALNRTLPHRDPLIFPAAMFLGGWGLALVWRLAPAFGPRQIAWLVLSIAAMIGVSFAPGDLRWLRRYRYLWLLGGLALTALTLLFGVNPSGGREELWLGCCGVYFQPSEILKLLLVTFLAAYLAEKRLLITSDSRRVAGIRLPTAYILPLLLMWGFSMVLLISQRDLGTSSLFLIVFLVMLYLASGEWAYLATGGVMLIASGALGYWLFDVVRIRIDAWLNPWIDSSGRSYQIVQSLIALAAGGLFGRGPGLGAPTVIPVVHSDFVFAAVAEEWGVLGAVGLLGIFAALVFRGLRCAATARGPFRLLLAAGLSVLIGVQGWLIAAGVARLIPLTGVTLPFVSYGGSSLLANFIAIGLLLRISEDSNWGDRVAESNHAP